MYFFGFTVFPFRIVGFLCFQQRTCGSVWDGIGIYVVRFTYIRLTVQAHTQTHIYTSASSHRLSQFQVNVSQFLFSQYLCNFNLSLNGNLPVLRWSNGPYTNFHTSSAGSFKPQICATFCGSHGSIKFAWLPPKIVRHLLYLFRVEN